MTTWADLLDMVDEGVIGVSEMRLLSMRLTPAKTPELTAVERERAARQLVELGLLLVAADGGMTVLISQHWVSRLLRYWLDVSSNQQARLW